MSIRARERRMGACVVFVVAAFAVSGCGVASKNSATGGTTGETASVSLTAASTPQLTTSRSGSPQELTEPATSTATGSSRANDGADLTFWGMHALTGSGAYTFITQFKAADTFVAGRIIAAKTAVDGVTLATIEADDGRLLKVGLGSLRREAGPEGWPTLEEVAARDLPTERVVFVLKKEADESLGTDHHCLYQLGCAIYPLGGNFGTPLGGKEAPMLINGAPDRFDMTSIDTLLKSVKAESKR